MIENPRVVTRARRSRGAEADTFQFQFDPALAGSGTPLGAYRANAWAHFNRIPLPTTKDEAWRRTDISTLEVSSFRLPGEGPDPDLQTIPDRLLQSVVDQEHGGEVRLTPGAPAQVEIDPALKQQGVIFTDFRSAEREYPELLARLVGQVIKPEEGKFAALAAALGQNGAFLYVPAGVQVAQPLHSLVWGPGVGLAHLTHVLVWLEEGAQVTYVHETASPDESGGQTLHSGIVELHVGENANLRFVELQSWGRHVWNFTHERARLAKDATLEWIFGAIGSHLTKNFSDIDLAGPGSTGRISGFYFTDGDQHLDHDTQQNHMAPNTTSDLLYKGALKGSSRSVWQGMIYVAPGADKTDGYQANRNLVLSHNARADSIPGLEILADDVRCTHGATVGKIDQEQVYYLCSRGIPQAEAEQLIVEGFFDPIMQRIPFTGVRERFQKAIHEKMDPAG